MKMNNFFILVIAAIVILTGCKKAEVENLVYYVNGISGDDSNDGRSPENAWKSLEQASRMEYGPGEKLLLCKGCTFNGKLGLKAQGTQENPVVVSSYSAGNGEENMPVIDAKGYTSAIWIENGKHVKIQNLELTADAGNPVEPEAETVRYGVYMEANTPGDYSDIMLQGLKIHRIFATENVEKDGQNPTSNMGYAIFIQMKDGEATISNVRIKNCQIERTGHTGIRIFGHRESDTYLDSLSIFNGFYFNKAQSFSEIS